MEVVGSSKIIESILFCLIVTGLNTTIGATTNYMYIICL